MVDTAVYIDHLRDGRDIRSRLMPYLAAGQLYGCGVIRAEVIRGVLPKRLKRELSAFFNIIPEVPTSAKFWASAADFAWEIDRTLGGSRPITDLAIALCALTVGATLVSPHRHFADIPNLKLTSDLP